MWDLIVSVPHQCLSFCFTTKNFKKYLYFDTFVGKIVINDVGRREDIMSEQNLPYIIDVK